jgi:hypothetical protein
VSWIALARLVWSLAPELRAAIAALIRALQSGNDAEARLAYEAARRLAFKAKQRR